MTVRAAGFVLLLLAASVVPAGAETTSTTLTATLDCADPPFGTPPAEARVFDDQVALLAGGSADQAMPAERLQRGPSPVLRFWSKSPLFVRTGTRAQIRVPRSERGRVAVTWGNTGRSGTATRVFSVGPCDGGIGWIGFPGGYFVDEPHCVRLIVRVGNRDRTTRIGVGSACPGQDPPPA
jgi:hypothetical protein